MRWLRTLAFAARLDETDGLTARRAPSPGDTGVLIAADDDEERGKGERGGVARGKESRPRSCGRKSLRKGLLLNPRACSNHYTSARLLTPTSSLSSTSKHHLAQTLTMDLPSVTSEPGTVGSRFVSQDEIDSAKARRDEQWKAAYARCAVLRPQPHTRFY